MAAKILVLGGTHGNERLGIELVALLKKRPVQGVDAASANPKAIKAGRRFVESDLNRSFGASFPDTYESRLAAHLTTLAQSYDVVLDFHNTQTPKNNCAFVGVGCDQQLFSMVKQLGLTRCIEATYDCINKYCLNTISVEISVGDELDDAMYWCKQIERLVWTNMDCNESVDVYRFNKRVTWQEKNKYKINDWQPFEELSSKDKRSLGVSGIIVPIFVGSTLTEFYATLLSRERTE